MLQWCGHCKQLEPIWEDLASALKGKAGIAKVDCMQEPGLRNEYRVDAFPTIKLFHEGRIAVRSVWRPVNGHSQSFRRTTKAGAPLARSSTSLRRWVPSAKRELLRRPPLLRPPLRLRRQHRLCLQLTASSCAISPVAGAQRSVCVAARFDGEHD